MARRVGSARAANVVSREEELLTTWLNYFGSAYVSRPNPSWDRCGHIEMPTPDGGYRTAVCGLRNRWARQIIDHRGSYAIS